MRRRDFLKAGIVLPLLPYVPHTEQPKPTIPSLDKYLKGTGLVTIIGPCGSGKTAIVRTIRDNYDGWGCHFDESYWRTPVIHDLLILGKTMHFPRNFFDEQPNNYGLSDTIHSHIRALQLNRSLYVLTYQLQKNNVLGVMTRQANRCPHQHEVMYTPLSVHYHSNVILSVADKEIKVVKNRWGEPKETIKIGFIQKRGVALREVGVPWAYERV